MDFCIQRGIIFNLILGGQTPDLDRWDMQSSTRSNRSNKWWDRSPMPTPSYKDNAWASKRSQRPERPDRLVIRILEIIDF